MSSFCDKFNIFNSPFTFYINSKSTLRSFCGLFLSSLGYMLLLYLFLDSDMIHHLNPKISDQMMSNMQPRILLNNKSFAPVIQLYEIIENNNTYEKNLLPIDPSYFSVTATQIKYNGKKSKETMSFQIHECKDDDFDESLRFEEYYQGKYCILRPNESITLSSQDSFLFGNRTTFSITLNICTNETSNNSCKPLSDILSYMKGKFFSLNFLDSSFLLEDYEHPERKNYGKYIESAINKNMMTKIGISFMEVEMILDDFFLYSDQKIQNYIQQDAGQKHNDVIYKTLEDFESDPTLVQFIFSPSYSKRVLKRKYQKLTDLLSLLGGLFSVFQFYGAFIANYFLHRRFLILFMKKLYSTEDLNHEQISNGLMTNNNEKKFDSKIRIEYEDIHNDDKKEIELKKEEKSQRNQEINKNIASINVLDLEKINGRKEDTQVRFSDVIKTYYFSQDMIDLKDTKQKKEFDISILDFMKYSLKTLFKYKKLNEKDKLIKKCEEIYRQEIEIFSILAKIKEIDKIKSNLEQNSKILTKNDSRIKGIV